MSDEEYVPLDFNQLIKDVAEHYPDPVDAESITKGMVISHHLFWINRMELPGLPRAEQVEGKEYNRIKTAFICGAKSMYETYASGNLEKILKGVSTAVKKKKEEEEEKEKDDKDG